MAQDNDPVYLTYGSARRLKRVADQVDGVAGPGTRGGRRGFGWTPSTVRAASTSTITGGSFHTPGGGTARIFYLVDGTWTHEEEDVDVYNDLSSTSIPSNTVLRLSWISGTWWVAEAACQAESTPIVGD